MYSTMEKCLFGSEAPVLRRFPHSLSDFAYPASENQACIPPIALDVLFISTENANSNVGRVLVRMSRGGQAVPVSSVIDSYRESTKNLSEVAKYADELLVHDNTAHRHGFRVVAHFIGGKLGKAAQTIPDWAAEVFGKELHAVKQHGKPGRGR
jgi:hypothetical protein